MERMDSVGDGKNRKSGTFSDGFWNVFHLIIKEKINFLHSYHSCALGGVISTVKGHLLADALYTLQWGWSAIEIAGVEFVMNFMHLKITVWPNTAIGM